MLDRLKRYLGFAEPEPRPYRDLSEEEIVERFARARVRLEAQGWNARSREVRKACENLMAEWEWRHDGLVDLEERARERETRLRENDLADLGDDPDWLEW